MAKSKTTVVGSPLTPDLLLELGAFQQLPATPNDFDPAGAWTNTYRIWTCHGYRESGNGSPGSLRLTRTPGVTAASFTLQVREQIENNEGRLDTTTAEVECRADELASPLRWALATAFTASDGKEATELGVKEEVIVDGERLRVRTGGRSVVRTGAARLTADWCLFEAVQRLPSASEALVFDLLERLALFKPQQRLASRGMETLTSGRQQLKAHCFQQLGRGVLPVEYFVDERHRLLLVTTGSKAYVLDNEAEQALATSVKKSQQWLANKAKEGK